MVVGDMVASVGTILIDPRDDGDMVTYLTQLKRLASLHIRTALPAHGEPVDSPESLFQRYIAHRLMREEKIFAALPEAGTEGTELEALVPAAYDDTSEFLWPLAQLSLEAHLIKLEREGRAQRSNNRWRRTAQEQG
jgi:glyoxylase-like metal-dependent hydrolase (beta-lactamase superfamily II)